jgi:hypothetical protein
VNTHSIFCDGPQGLRDSEWMSGSAKAGTIAERHACELRGLPEFAVRAPPKRASGESFSPLTKDLHGSRQTGNYFPLRNIFGPEKIRPHASSQNYLLSIGI